MRELLELLAVFAGIYLFDCVHWVRREALGLRAWWSKRLHIVSGAETAGNERFGLLIAQPLPVFGRLFLTQAFPLSLTPEGAASFVTCATNPGSRPAQVERFIRFDEAHTIAVEARRVLVDERVFVEAGSNRLARHVAELLRELVPLSPAERKACIDRWVSSTLAVDAVRERGAAFESAARSVRIFCVAEWALVFVVTPIVGLQFGLALTWIPLLSGLVVLQAAVTFTFARAHAVLFPTELRARRSEAILIALSPPSAMRAVDALSRDILAEIHPLAAAAALLSRAEFEDLGERTLRDALHPLPIVREAADPDVRRAADAWRARTLTALENLMRREGVECKPWSNPPQRLEEDCLSYCPRCTRQFTVESGACERCQGLELAAFPAT